jgi:rsbT antagonist protein RsbS
VARVPVVRIGDILVATVQEDLYDRDALGLQSEVTDLLERTGARGVLIDLSTVQMVDSFLGRLIGEIAVGSRLMGAETVVVGMRPAVALTLVELGLSLPGVRTALDADKGHALLHRLIATSNGVVPRNRRYGC